MYQDTQQKIFKCYLDNEANVLQETRLNIIQQLLETMPANQKIYELLYAGSYEEPQYPKDITVFQFAKYHLEGDKTFWRRLLNNTTQKLCRHVLAHRSQMTRIINGFYQLPEGYYLYADGEQVSLADMLFTRLQSIASYQDKLSPRDQFITEYFDTYYEFMNELMPSECLVDGEGLSYGYVPLDRQGQQEVLTIVSNIDLMTKELAQLSQSNDAVHKEDAQFTQTKPLEFEIKAVSQEQQNSFSRFFNF